MRALPIVVLSLVLGPTRAYAEPVYYQVQVNYFGSVKGHIRFNGVVLSDFAGNGSYSGALNVWLRPGDNEVLLHIETGEKPSGPGDKVELYVVEAKPGQFADELPHLLTLDWKTGDPLPANLETRFRAPRAPLVDLWSKAEAALLDDAAKRALTKLARDFHQAVSSRDAKAMVTLAKFKIEDVGRAFGMDAARASQAASTELEASMAELAKTAKVDPFDPKAIRFVSMADGKLVKITGDRGQPPIVLRDKASETSFEIFAARIGGAWMIVR